MASAASATTPSFTFRLTQPSYSPKSKPHLTFPLKPYPLHKHPNLQITVSNSIDVSKEDKPISDPLDPASASAESVPETTKSVPETIDAIDKRRLEEKFAVLNTGIYECRSCGYLYNEAAGDASYPIPPGLTFERLPEDWRCPTCGAAKSFFQSKSVEIAGFAQNQQFGLGGNTLTSGQKALLIYGSLLFFFVLFLSGYFLQ